MHSEVHVDEIILQTYIAPMCCMVDSRLTMHLSLAIAMAPFARFVFTIRGNICGVSATATEIPNITLSPKL